MQPVVSLVFWWLAFVLPTVLLGELSLTGDWNSWRLEWGPETIPHPSPWNEDDMPSHRKRWMVGSEEFPGMGLKAYFQGLILLFVSGRVCFFLPHEELQQKTWKNLLMLKSAIARVDSWQFNYVFLLHLCLCLPWTWMADIVFFCNRFQADLSAALVIIQSVGRFASTTNSIRTRHKKTQSTDGKVQLHPPEN